MNREEIIRIAIVFGIAFGSLFRWQKRPRPSWAYTIGAMVVGGLALYQILWVGFGAGRTGWP